MLSAALFLLANSLFLTLRLTGDTGSFPKPLSAGEERMYLERSLAGDLEARNILVEHNLRLVAHIIKKYYTQAAEQEDLISIGTIGLIKAVDTFRPERKIRLATYASRCVENEVLMYIRIRTLIPVSLFDVIDNGPSYWTTTAMNEGQVTSNAVNTYNTAGATAVTKVERNGIEYYEYDFTFTKAVKPGELTFWNVWGNIAINKDATAEELANVNSFDVIFEADAIQAEGFADAAAAFAAFDGQ